MAIRYEVKSGDCIASIAFAHGFFPGTVWDDPGNEALRKQRKNPNILMPGDVVTVPDLRAKEVVCPSGQIHRFERFGVPEKFRAQLTIEGDVRGGLAYKLVVDGVEKAGQTDGEGHLEQWIPPGAKRGSLIVGEGDAQETYDLVFGSLDPIESDSGVRGRLRNLGFLDERDSDAALRMALRRFQAAQRLAATGLLDDTTRAKLAEVYGL